MHILVFILIDTGTCCSLACHGRGRAAQILVQFSLTPCFLLIRVHLISAPSFDTRIHETTFRQYRYSSMSLGVPVLDDNDSTLFLGLYSKFL